MVIINSIIQANIFGCCRCWAPVPTGFGGITVEMLFCISGPLQTLLTYNSKEFVKLIIFEGGIVPSFFFTFMLDHFRGSRIINWYVVWNSSMTFVPLIIKNNHQCHSTRRRCAGVSWKLWRAIECSTLCNHLSREATVGPIYYNFWSMKSLKHEELKTCYWELCFNN